MTLSFERRTNPWLSGLLSASLLLALCACETSRRRVEPAGGEGEGEGEEDLGQADGGLDLSLDLGEEPAPDAGLDLEPQDLPPEDAGVEDLGESDGGEPGDTGPEDTGPVDQGAPDEGPEIDPDLGPPDQGPDEEDLSRPDLGEEPFGRLVVTFLDVQQGDAALLQLPTGQVVLIDGGDNGRGEDIILPFLWERDIERLDLMVLSHPHADHCGGLDEVIEGGIEVAEVWENGERSGSGTYDDFRDAVGDSGALRFIPAQGYRRVYGEVVLRVMNREEGYAGMNNDSLVIQVSFEDVVMLFTGDIETAEQRDLMGDYPGQLGAQILKVPHHGSDSMDASFPGAVGSTWAVISSGVGNRYGHPHQVTLAAYERAGAAICRTDQLGDIVFSTDGYRVESSCAAP